MPPAHPREFRERAIELARERAKPIGRLAKDLGISESCLRGWLSQADIDQGHKPGLTSAEREELVKAPPREPRAAHGEGDLGKSRGLLRHRERPSAELSFELIDVEKAHYPIAVMCRVLEVSTSGFYEWVARRANPSPRTAANAELTVVWIPPLGRAAAFGG